MDLDLKQIRAERPRILKRLVSAADFGDESPLAEDILQAAITGNLAAIEHHIATGTDLNQTEGLGGSTPLILATIFDHPEVVQRLIEAGADVEIRNKSQGTALHQACFFCRPEIVELLLAAEADTEKVNFLGLTPRVLVERPLDDGWKAVYEHAYQSLNLDLDFDEIQQSRNRIAVMFRERTDSGKQQHDAIEPIQEKTQ